MQKNNQIVMYAQIILFLLFTSQMLIAKGVIVNGELTPDSPENGKIIPDFPETGLLLFKNYSGNLSAQCTVTLIGNQTLLTAAHCFESEDYPLRIKDPENFQVFFQHAGYFRVMKYISHPEYNLKEKKSDADIAVVKISKAVQGIVPSKINVSQVVPNGISGIIVGFGRTGGTNHDYGIKRFGQVKIEDCTPNHPVKQPTSVCWEYNNINNLPGEVSNTCNVDSGGPLFINFGEGKIIGGVTSGGTEENCSSGDHSYDTSVFHYRDWIQQILLQWNTPSTWSYGNIGDEKVQVIPKKGELTSIQREKRHSFLVNNEAQELRVTLNAVEKYDRRWNLLTDFDLYVRIEGEPTQNNFSCSQTQETQFGSCVFKNPKPGIWHILVRSKKGNGLYQVTITLFNKNKPYSPLP